LFSPDISGLRLSFELKRRLEQADFDLEVSGPDSTGMLYARNLRARCREG